MYGVFEELEQEIKRVVIINTFQMCLVYKFG